MDDLELVKRYTISYLRSLTQLAGGKWDLDNSSEVSSIIDDLALTIAERVEKELVRKYNLKKSK